MSERISFSEMLKATDQKEKERRLSRKLNVSKDEIHFTESEAEFLLELIQEYKIAYPNTKYSSYERMIDRRNFIEEIERKLTILSQQGI